MNILNFHQVSFIAINCWTGSCRKHNFPNSYPLLFLVHTKYEPVEYRGRRKFIDMVSLLMIAAMVTVMVVMVIMMVVLTIVVIVMVVMVIVMMV